MARLKLKYAHKVMCGDAANAEEVAELMNGNKADMVFCDPPYNVDYGNTMKDRTRSSRAGSKAGRTILNDNLGEGFGAFLYDALANMISVCDGPFYVCMSSSELHTLYDVFVKAGGHWSTFVIWAKNTFTIGRSDYQRQYEPILYGWKEGIRHFWSGARDQGDVWFVDKPVRNDLHPTMKPVELVEKAVLNSSKRGEIILDLFAGSGTTVIAAEKNGRSCYACELDPKYVDVIVERWERFTGRKGVLAGKEGDSV